MPSFNFSLFTPDSAQRTLTTFASDLGFVPGEFPRTIVVDGLPYRPANCRFTFYFVQYNGHQSATYRSNSLAYTTLEVFND